MKAAEERLRRAEGMMFRRDRVDGWDDCVKGSEMWRLRFGGGGGIRGIGIGVIVVC